MLSKHSHFIDQVDNQYIIKGILHSSIDAPVLHAVDALLHEQYAIKIFKKNVVRAFTHEIEQNHKMAKHPNILSPIKWTDQISGPLISENSFCTAYAYIVLPYHRRGSMLDLLCKLGRFTLPIEVI